MAEDTQIFENSISIQEEKSDNIPFLKRAFGPLEPGSLRGSIFNMIILTLGSGCLSLPRYVGEISLSFSVFLIIVIGLLVWWNLNLLSSACDISNNYVYSRLVKDKYGNGISLFFNIIVMLYVFGVLILNQVIIFTLTGETIYSLFYYNQFETIEQFMSLSFWSTWVYKCGFIYSVGFCIIFPLCLIKDVSKLRIASLLGVITLVGIILLLIIQVLSYYTYYSNNIYEKNDPMTHLNIWDLRRGFTSQLDFFQYCGSLYYAYISAIGAVPIFSTMKTNNLRRIQKVIRRSIFFDIIFFSIIVICGYLTWPINTPALIIEREKITQGADIPMSIGRMALVLTIIMKLPNNYNSLRICLFDLIWGTTEITSGRNVVMSLVVLSICLTVAILYSEISSYIKLIGGICSGVVGFIIPALLYTRVNDYPRWNWKNIGVMVICFGLAVIGFIAAGKTLYDMIAQ